jgi:hypothetical protein
VNGGTFVLDFFFYIAMSLIAGSLAIGFGKQSPPLILFGGILMLVCGAMLFSEGLSKQDGVHIVSNADATDINTFATYQVYTPTDNSWVWVLANTLFYGAFAVFVLALWVQYTESLRGE